MTYEVYRYIFIGAAILSGLMLAAAVALFFVLKIPNVIGDLTGANARKAIADIRNQNEATGTKTYKPSAVNRERGRVTDKMTPSGRLLRFPSAGMGGGHETTKISTAKLSQEAMEAANQTTVLDAADETTVLSLAQETTVLYTEETTVLQPAAGETMVLDAGAVPVQTVSQPESGFFFEIEYEITCIHTREVI